MFNKRNTIKSIQQFENNSTMSQSTATTVKSQANTLPVNLEERKKKNDAWISAFKKSHGIKKQSVLPSSTTQHNEWAIKSGWSMSDATTWRGLCEKVKYAMDDTEGIGLLCLIAETIEIANHCDSHPVGLIHFARTAHDRKVWDLETIDYLKANLLPAEDDHHVEVDHDDDGMTPPNTPPSPKRKASAPGAPQRKRMYEASQPFDMDDDVVRD